MKTSSLYLNVFLIFSFLNLIFIKANDYDNLENYDTNGYYDNINDLNIVSISYELSYDDTSIVRVLIKTYYELGRNIKFKAFLKTEDELNEHLLECSNEFVDSILCLSAKNITLDTEKKYYFYYNKKKSGSDITIDGEDVYEDDKRISLIFNPEVPGDQILYKDNRRFDVKNGNYMVSSGYLYITKKSKKILQNTKNGFNKYIQLNNFIPHCGLAGYLPQSSLIGYKEAIRRGYKIVDADLLFTKDKIPVICHGIDLKKVSNGEGDLTEKTLEELEQLDFGSVFSEQYKGSKILKFEDLLKLCKENNIIIDIDLGHLNYNKFFLSTNEYIKIFLEYIEKYGMTNSIFINEARPQVIEKFVAMMKTISISINGMNEKQSIEKEKDKYKDSKILIYNMGGLLDGKTINEEAVKYGLSLGKKIKASKIDELNFANKVISWGVNFICTNKLHPFYMKNEKEEPIVATCTLSDTDEGTSECDIDSDYNLIDNEIYSVYYSKNIYNLSEDIVETPIGEFKYIDTNLLDELYYEIVQFDFKNGIIKLNTSNIVKKGEKIIGRVGPAYENVAECFVYNFVCQGNGNRMVNCVINKNDQDKVPYDGDYKIYSLEGYSLNPEQVYNKINYQKHMRRFKIITCIIIIVVIILVALVYFIKIRSEGNYRFIKIKENSYMSDNYLFR